MYFSNIIIVDAQPEEAEPIRANFVFNLGRTDSSNRYMEMPLLCSRGNSAFTYVNPGEDIGVSRAWSSFGFSVSRPPTIQADPNKLVISSQQEIEERREETEKPEVVENSIGNLIANKYFSNTGIFNGNHKEIIEKKYNH